ncbi:hypothetical protein [Parasphaerochaeta coccoides]|uniref:Uncharacterized protein n=1 Tax=Parasphaerochaeta coccoides (strain ATCC BAA-1237 / DSM 17374 / SPN1) TaxID=760011 RepID=F4GIB6_PARC1|nr:hypothetical protein [Parasphaerochaeta coccoides]AEC01275.1 hypothetical protein Spico_0033 [Parasphaerochaeta coccoides DSM 17374]
MAWLKPDVKKLEQRRNVKGLIKAMKYAKDDGTTSMLALMALKDMKAKEAIPAIEKFLMYASRQHSDFYTKDTVRRCCDCLRAMDYEPTNQEIGAFYWGNTSQYDKLATCDPALAIPQFFAFFARGGYCEKWLNAYLALDAVTGFMSLLAFTGQIFEQYKSFTKSTPSINYSLDSDKRKAAYMEHLVTLLQNAVDVVCAYKHNAAFSYLIQLYNQVNEEIYSDPEGGFPDMFRAVKIRSHIVVRVGQFPFENFGEQICAFLSNVLNYDRADLVKHEAMMGAEKLPPHLKQYQPLQSGLRTFYDSLTAQKSSLSMGKSYWLKPLEKLIGLES